MEARYSCTCVAASGLRLSPRAGAQHSPRAAAGAQHSPRAAAGAQHEERVHSSVLEDVRDPPTAQPHAIDGDDLVPHAQVAPASRRVRPQRDHDVGVVEVCAHLTEGVHHCEGGVHHYEGARP